MTRRCKPPARQLSIDFVNFKPQLDDRAFARAVADVINLGPRRGPRTRKITIREHERRIVDRRRKRTA